MKCRVLHSVVGVLVLWVTIECRIGRDFDDRIVYLSLQKVSVSTPRLLLHYRTYLSHVGRCVSNVRFGHSSYIVYPGPLLSTLFLTGLNSRTSFQNGDQGHGDSRYPIVKDREFPPVLMTTYVALRAT